MKTNKYFLMAMLGVAGALTSCDDKNDCGCDCSQPVIERMELVNNPGVSLPLDTLLPSGSTVVIYGQNLGGVKGVYFGETKAVLKPAFVTDNSLVYTIPTLFDTETARYVTSSCAAGFTAVPLAGVGMPTVTMFANEMVADGDTLKIKGNSFISSVDPTDTERQVKVFFHDGTGYNLQAELIGHSNNTPNEILAVVPAGTADGFPIKVTNVRGESESRILFRNKTNVILDFEGDVDKTFYDGDTLSKYPGMFPDWACKSKFGLITMKELDGRSLISYQPYIELDPSYSTNVFGAYHPLLASGELDVTKFCVKFELFVPESAPLVGDVLTFGFTNGEESGMEQFRLHSAFFCPTVPVANKPTPEAKTTLDWMSDKFYTNEWVTVRIPFSEFVWSAMNMSYGSSYENFKAGNFTVAADAQCFADSERRSYAQVWSDITDEEVLMLRWGGFILGFFQYDGGSGMKHPKGFGFGIDNIRIVPDDGNGMYIPALNYGVPAVDYYRAPILK